MEKKTVFVYGTLKRGFGANHMFADSEYKGQALLEDVACLGNGYGFPRMILNPEIAPKCDLIADVYEVEREDVLNRLDTYEGHPHHFHRTPTVAISLDNGSEIHGEVYQYTDRSVLEEVAQQTKSGFLWSEHGVPVSWGEEPL